MLARSPRQEVDAALVEAAPRLRWPVRWPVAPLGATRRWLTTLSYATLARQATMAAILALSVLLELYRLGDWQSFADDQALQLTMMHGLLIDHHLPFFGMSLSVGQAHLGPLFYYGLALPMWLGHLDPTSGVVLVGLCQVATVFVIYRLGLLIEAPWAGTCAAALYATSAFVVHWSRFLWPNVSPLFIALSLYALVAMKRDGRGHLLLLVGSVAAAAQMLPTSVLFIPVAAAAALALRPRVSWRTLAGAVGLALLLYAPAIVHDALHNFEEARAWLDYGATLWPGTPGAGGLPRSLDNLDTMAWHALGLRDRLWANIVLAPAIAATCLGAAGVGGPLRATLCRIMLFCAAFYLLIFSLYHGELHPHYTEPIFPLPFLALGLLADLAVTLPRRLWEYVSHTVPAHAAGEPVERPRAATALAICARLGTAAAVAALCAVNLGLLWQNHFGLDPYQLDSIAETQGTALDLGEMRAATGLIEHSANGQPYSLLIAVRDGSGGGFQYLQRTAAHPPTGGLQKLQFLIVEPEDRPPWLWPAATRGRWAYTGGGFVRLPHLTLWRLRLRGPTPQDTGPWQTTPYTAGMLTAVLARPDQGGVLAAFVGGSALSADDGATWQASRWRLAPSNGLLEVTSYAVSAACPNRLYAGTFDGVITSDDGGASWGRLAHQPISPEVLALHADAARCGVLIAGTRDGIARTMDGGRTWEYDQFGAGRFDAGHRLAVHALAVDDDGHTVYAGTIYGVWKSADGGATWPELAQYGSPRPALCLLLHVGRPERMLAGTGSGVVFSGDGGVTWAPTGKGLDGAVYALLSVDRHGDVIAGTDSGIYHSSDNGASWSRADLPPGLTAGAFSDSGTVAQVIYAATNMGLYRSTDGGQTWQHA